MKNKEKYAKEIVEIASKGSKIAIVCLAKYIHVVKQHENGQNQSTLKSQ